MTDQTPLQNMDPPLAVTPATRADLAAILRLLEENGLPQAGVKEHLDAALVARAGQTIIGSAVLELYGPVALLRSVAVAAPFRGRGLGRRLTTAALALARRRGVVQVYLLTETAGQFFPRLGFRPIDRSRVPAAVQSSLEFTTLCPVSALVLALSLTAGDEDRKTAYES